MNREEILKLAEKAELVSLDQTKNKAFQEVKEIIENQTMHFAELLFEYWKNENKPNKVSPLDFVTITLEKEHLVGRPIIWAEWPNAEKT